MQMILWKKKRMNLNFLFDLTIVYNYSKKTDSISSGLASLTWFDTVSYDEYGAFCK